MSETETPAYQIRGWAGWPAAVGAYKIAVEQAIAAASAAGPVVGFWMLPKVGKNPSNLAGQGALFPGFIYAVPPSFVDPPAIEQTIPMSEETATALQPVLQAEEDREG